MLKSTGRGTVISFIAHFWRYLYWLEPTQHTVSQRASFPSDYLDWQPHVDGVWSLFAPIMNQPCGNSRPFVFNPATAGRALGFCHRCPSLALWLCNWLSKFLSDVFFVSPPDVAILAWFANFQNKPSVRVVKSAQMRLKDYFVDLKINLTDSFFSSLIHMHFTSTGLCSL